ncbi:MAG: DUF2171 domain-containing protein [Pseudomonadota bacterium]
MAYDRYDTRDERSRWQRDRTGGESRDWDRGRSSTREDRGFFERAGDEIASWFGGDDDDRGRQDHRHDERSRPSGEHGREEFMGRERERDRDWNEDGGRFFGSGRHERDHGRSSQGSERGEHSYRPMTGDYGRSSRGGYDRSQETFGRDDYRSTSRAGTSDRSDRSRHDDPHYDSWRRQQMESLDRDYEDYRRENQSRFENDFGSWRERRQQKRGLLRQVREHMEVVGNDDQHIGKVDRVAGDRIILAKSDAESGGAHHSLSCSDIDRVEGDKLILDCSAEQAKQRWRDESRSRALFEREDQGEMGPRALNRSFEGTYR